MKLVVGLLSLLLTASSMAAETIVLANRSPLTVHFTLLRGAGDPRSFLLAAGEVRAVPVDGTATIEFTAGEESRSYELDGNSIYFFHGRAAPELNLEGIRLGQSAARPSVDRTAATSTSSDANRSAAWHDPPTFKIPVTMLVDDEERAARARWEDRLRQRLAAASGIIERHCGVGFELLKFEVWESDDSITDFRQALREFKTKVRGDKARIAIGFTSQYVVPQGRTNLGGTQGPLDTHILVREWSQHVSEPERLEILVHELGHFLGAAHSPEQDSIMRPVLGDRQSLARSFRIGFDPLNTLAMNLVANGLRDHQVRSLADLPVASRKCLTDIYSSIGQALPKDPAAGVYLKLLSSFGADSAEF